jgi:hypothetical protein
LRGAGTPAPNALAVGGCWLLVAIVFEFGLGYLVDGLPSSRLLSEYDLSRGRLLLLVWLTVGLGPFVLTRMRDELGWTNLEQTLGERQSLDQIHRKTLPHGCVPERPAARTPRPAGATRDADIYTRSAN